MVHLGIRVNIYPYAPDIDPSEFILLAVQHYFIVYGKDVEPEKMREVVQYLLPSPYTAAQNANGSKSNKGMKPLLSEKQIEEIVMGAMQKDADVGEQKELREHDVLISLSSTLL